MSTGFGNVALASGVVEVAAEVGEGGEAAAGFDEALDDVVRFGGLVGIPVVGDGLGDAAGLDDGEFGGEFALEGVDGAADFGEGHGVTSDGELFAWMDGMKGIGDWDWDGGAPYQVPDRGRYPAFGRGSHPHPNPLPSRERGFLMCMRGQYEQMAFL